MTNKTILIVDDEIGYIEALEDGLISEGFRVLKATTVADALTILKKEHIDLITIDIILSPGTALESQLDSHTAGLYLCQQVRKNYPKIYVFCISVISDYDTIKNISKMGINFLRKGETPLRIALTMMKSKLTGVSYTSSDSGNTDYRKRYQR